MPNRLKQFLILISGFNSKLLESCTPTLLHKVLWFSSILLICSFISASTLALSLWSLVFDRSPDYFWTAPVITVLIMIAIVLIDTTIVSNPRPKGWLKWFRIAPVMALLGIHLIAGDALLLSEDIRQAAKDDHVAALQTKGNKEISDLEAQTLLFKQELSRLDSTKEAKDSIYQAELDGEANSGRIGPGPISNRKLQLAEDYKLNVYAPRAKFLNKSIIDNNAQVNRARSTMKAALSTFEFGEVGLNKRLNLLSWLQKNKQSTFGWIFIIAMWLIILSIDLLPIIFGLSMPIDEYQEAYTRSREVHDVEQDEALHIQKQVAIIDAETNREILRWQSKLRVDNYESLARIADITRSLKLYLDRLEEIRIKKGPMKNEFESKLRGMIYRAHEKARLQFDRILEEEALIS